MKCVKKKMNLKVEQTKEERMQNLIKQWLYNKINGKEIVDYCKRKEIQELAIYGIGWIGEMLYDDIVNNSSIRVRYIIDKNADSLYYGIENMDVLKVDELKKAPRVDAIFVTPLFCFESVKRELREIINAETRIISIEDMIYEVE